MHCELQQWSLPGALCGSEYLETHTVRVPVVVRTGVRITSQECGAYFTYRDDAGWAAVYTELATSTDIIIDDEYNSVCRIRTREFSVRRCRYRVRCHHKNTLPRAYIYTPFTSDALRLVNVNELFRFNSATQIGSIYLYEVVL